MRELENIKVANYKVKNDKNANLWEKSIRNITVLSPGVPSLVWYFSQ